MDDNCFCDICMEERSLSRASGIEEDISALKNAVTMLLDLAGCQKEVTE